MATPRSSRPISAPKPRTWPWRCRRFLSVIDPGTGLAQIHGQPRPSVLAAVAGVAGVQLYGQPLIDAACARRAGAQASRRSRCARPSAGHTCARPESARVALRSRRTSPRLPREVRRRFFRISLSNFSREFSARSLASSTWTSSPWRAVVFFTAGRPRRARLTQLASVFSDISRLRATSLTDRPASITWRTVASRYCSVYALFSTCCFITKLHEVS